MNDAIRMQVSAFVDGELPENEAEMLLRRMSQDDELRELVAEYLGTGRLIRCERSVAGMDRLRDRITAELDERPLQEDITVDEPRTPRYVRPLAGVAIAATVTLVAIFSLQQTALIADQPDAAGSSSVAGNGSAEEAYTVPPDEMLLEYRLSHGANSLDLGSRLVSLRIRGGELIEVDAESPEQDETDVAAPDATENETP